MFVHFSMIFKYKLPFYALDFPANMISGATASLESARKLMCINQRSK